MTEINNSWIHMTSILLLLFTSPAFAQTQTQKFHEYCASAEELERTYHEPAPQYADGNGDRKANDYLMQRI
jgi:hypothetical protein